MTLHALPNLFQRCREKKTGHWCVGRDHKRTIYLDMGDIVFASSTYAEDKLTAVLVDSGKVSHDQMTVALKNLKPGISIGKNLIEMGHITQADLLEAARLQVARIVRCALAATEEPTFEEKDELEQSIVRLPLDTALLLFMGVTGVQDREALQELLGPMNQVVVLQGKRVNDLDIPDNLKGLSKAIPKMDGTHTILEIAGETKLDAVTLGAFALFLREMGWAKLIELPPLNRQELDKALTLPEPTKPPPATQAPRSPLIEDIKKAEMPTTNLSHLAKELDKAAGTPATTQNPPEDQAQSARPTVAPDPPLFGLPGAQPPQLRPDEETPTSEFGGHLEEHEENAAEPVGRVIIVPEPEETHDESLELPIVLGGDEPDNDETTHKRTKRIKGAKAPKAPKAPKGYKASKTTSRKPVVGILVLILLVILGVTLMPTVKRYLPTYKSRPPFTLKLEDHLTRERYEADKDKPRAPSETPSPNATQPQTAQTDKPAQTQMPQAAPQAQPQTVKPVQAAPVAPSPTWDTQPPREERRSGPPPDFSVAARFAAVSQGNTSTAIEQGRAYRDRLSKSAWTIRLVVAEQKDTLKNCANSFGGAKPDIFVMPIRMRNGRQCYQLFLGSFPNKPSAEEEAKKLPEMLRKQSPRLMQVSEITEVQ